MQAVTVLIADEDSLTRKCLRRVVESDPLYTVCWEAENGLKALHLAKEHSPDVVLADAQLDRMDGFEMTGCLRRCLPETYIIVIGALEQSRDRALEMGADEFVAKDCGREELRAVMARLADAMKHRAGDTGRLELTGQSICLDADASMH